jgi:serine phosphatase RsbU (regulator of sigma subunit)
VGIIALRLKRKPGVPDRYVPDYVRRVYERERIQRELEIARNVQVSFLPRHNPDIPHLDVATLCVPAKEVGGDYYDFIELGQDRLGVVIGDVSGKGISAAFYMTLTKGLLKAQARSGGSPRAVLTLLNELFYENAERGIFISMIYGIFDLKRRTLTFARAGHNPMMLRSCKKEMVEELSSPGIALGLESGEAFARTIEERTIGIEKDDIFIFYTDGINEARGKQEDEFGEDRLMLLIERNGDMKAGDLIEEIKAEIGRFTRNIDQHDDMTAVVIKIV